MAEFVYYFLGYKTRIVERLNQHPCRDDILAGCSSVRPLDDVLAYLCQRLGTPPNEWSVYTASLTPLSGTGPPTTLSALDRRVAQFNHRFGTVVVLSNTPIATMLRDHFAIRVIELSEFDLFKRRVDTIQSYKNAENCMVVGLVENKEIAMVLKDGVVSNFSINSAPMVRPDIIYIVGKLAQKQLSILPPHKRPSDTFIGQDLPSIRLISQHHTLTPTFLLFGAYAPDTFVDLARWEALTDRRPFTLVTRDQVKFCTQHGECLEAADVGSAKDFILRREI